MDTSEIIAQVSQQQKQKAAHPASLLRVARHRRSGSDTPASGHAGVLDDRYHCTGERLRPQPIGRFDKTWRAMSVTIKNVRPISVNDVRIV
jgi:hypothetical protein